MTSERAGTSAHDQAAARNGRTTGRTRTFVEDLLARADIRVGGDRPWDLDVHDERFFERILANGSMGLGESYMDGWWDARAIDAFIHRVWQARLDRYVRRSPEALRLVVAARLTNRQRRSRASHVVERHYDLDNDLFERMLDPYLQYTCGYWRDTTTLDAAQEAKLDLICRKLDLRPGMTLLDIGCGWGGLARFAAQRYGARVTGITISNEQLAYARERCAGLPVEIRFQDYRDLAGSFDRITVVGMVEHVGYKNYRRLARVVHRCLRDDGLFLLHTIGNDVSKRSVDPWVDRYIFPNGMMPAPRQIAAAFEGLFVIEDWHNFGGDYDPTLMAWHRNFTDHWEHLRQRFDERFRRMWTYWLLMSAGTFRARMLQLFQVVASKRGVAGGYRSVR